MYASKGLDKIHLFSHHGNLYSRYMITMYDQEYGHRGGQISGNRAWDRHRLSWAPEASDIPVSGRFNFYSGAVLFYNL